MNRHLVKNNFPVMGVTVIALEILAFFVFVLGVGLAILNMLSSFPIFTPIGVIVVVLGVLVSSFIILAFAEFLQLLLKIEVNTRKEVMSVSPKVSAPEVKVAPVKRKK